MSDADDFMKFVEKFMAEVPGGPEGDAEMRRRDPHPFVDTTAADVHPDDLTDAQIQSWFDYMAWNLWELIATRSTEGESGLIPRQEYETLSFVQQWSVNPNAYRIIHDAVGTDGLIELGRVPRREIGTKVNHIRNYASALMAMLGRGVCVSLEQLDPTIRRDDIEICVQSARRLWHGTWGDGPGLASGRGFVLPLLEDGVLQPLLAAAKPVGDDAERTAFRRFNATTELFGFLMHYDTRLGMGDTGPYPLPGGGFALIRDHFLNEEGYSWSTIGEGLPYAVTEVLTFRPDPIDIKINDIGTTFTKPADYLKSLDSVAVFARDTIDTPMSGIRPVGAEEMKRIVATCQAGVLKMYKILSGKTRDEKIRDGVQMYSHEFMRPLAQRAGVWDQVLAGGFDDLADATQAAWPILTGGRAAEILAPAFLMGKGFPSFRSPAGGLMLTDADDRRHRLNPDPLARESLIFLLFLPEENLGAIAYTWVDGEGVAGSMITVFGQDNERLIHHVVQGVQVDAAADFTDWQVGPLRVEHGEPHKHARVAFDHDGVSLDYHFTAINEAFSYHDNADGCPSFLADDRLEQCGLVTGTLTIGDRRIDVDTTGHRDHSWGTRDWTAFHHYKWVNVQAGADVAVNFMHGLAMDRQYELGYVHRDGEQSPVVSIKADVERDDEHYAYTSARFVVTDEKGRVTEIETGNRTSLIVWPAGGLVSRDAASRCTVAGLPGIVHIEEGWTPEFVEHRLASATQRQAEQSGMGE